MRLSPWTETSFGSVLATGGLLSSAALTGVANSVLMNRMTKTIRLFFIGFPGSFWGFAVNSPSYSSPAMDSAGFPHNAWPAISIMGNTLPLGSEPRRCILARFWRDDAPDHRGSFAWILTHQRRRRASNGEAEGESYHCLRPHRSRPLP